MRTKTQAADDETLKLVDPTAPISTSPLDDGHDNTGGNGSSGGMPPRTDYPTGPSGVYVSVRPTARCAARIKNFFSLAGFPTVELSDLHVTLMYDEKSDLKAFRQMIRTSRLTEPSPVAEVAGFDKFGDEKDCLVMKLKAPILDAIHSELKDLGLKHSYSSFKAHMTLSYAGKDIKTAGLPKPDFPLEFEPWIEVRGLNKNWKSGLKDAGGLRWVFKETHDSPYA